MTIDQEAIKRVEAILPDLDAAALPTKCEVFAICGGPARQFHADLTTLLAAVKSEPAPAAEGVGEVDGKPTGVAGWYLLASEGGALTLRVDVHFQTREVAANYARNWYPRENLHPAWWTGIGWADLRLTTPPPPSPSPADALAEALEEASDTLGEYRTVLAIEGRYDAVRRVCAVIDRASQALTAYRAGRGG